MNLFVSLVHYLSFVWWLVLGLGLGLAHSYDLVRSLNFVRTPLDRRNVAVHFASHYTTHRIDYFQQTRSENILVLQKLLRWVATKLPNTESTTYWPQQWVSYTSTPNDGSSTQGPNVGSTNYHLHNDGSSCRRRGLCTERPGPWLLNDLSYILYTTVGVPWW